MKLTTTLDLLHKAGACEPGYRKLLKSLGTDYPRNKPINLLDILESNGLDDALWAMCATEQDCEKIDRLMAADFAELALPIWYKYYPDDKLPELAIRAARDYAHGRIEAAAREAAGEAARSSARSATWYATWNTAREAAEAAARAAARSASQSAAGSIAWATARAAARAAARDADGNAAENAAREAARDAQRKIFVSYADRDATGADKCSSRRGGKNAPTHQGGDGWQRSHTKSW